MAKKNKQIDKQIDKEPKSNISPKEISNPPTLKWGEVREDFSRVWASKDSKNRRKPPDEKYMTGWVSEIPTYQVLNYLQYRMDCSFKAIISRGIPEWGWDGEYTMDSLAWDNEDNQIYVCTSANPTPRIAPSKNPSDWQVSSLIVHKKDIDEVLDQFRAHMHDTNNPHRITAEQIGTYTKQQVDDLVNIYHDKVERHVRDYDNPHRTTAEQIGAVPITGGNYYGDVFFSTGKVFLKTDRTATIEVNDKGFFLRRNNSLLGLNNDGIGVVGPEWDLQPILTEKELEKLILEKQSLYTLPQPIFKSNFVWDTNTQIGAEYWTDPYTRFNELGYYTFHGGTDTLSNNPLYGRQKGSIGIHIYPLEDDWGAWISLYNMDININSDNLTVNSFGKNIDIFGYNAPKKHELFKLVVTFDKWNTLCYINGKEVGFGEYTEGNLGNTASIQGNNIGVASYTLWTQKLTHEQVTSF